MSKVVKKIEFDIPDAELKALVKKEMDRLKRKVRSLEGKLETRDGDIQRLKADLMRVKFLSAQNEQIVDSIKHIAQAILDTRKF